MANDNQVIWKTGVRRKSDSFSSKRTNIHLDYTNNHGERKKRKTASPRSEDTIREKERPQHTRMQRFFCDRKLKLCEKKRVYFSGTRDETPPNMPAASIGHSVLDKFKGAIADTNAIDNGALLVAAENGEFVAIKPKQVESGEQLYNNHTTTRVFDQLLTSKKLGNNGANARSSTKLVAQTDGDAKNVFLGPKCCRNARGTFDLSHNMTEKQRNEIFKIMKVGEKIVRSNVPPDYVKCHEEALVANKVR